MLNIPSLFPGEHMLSGVVRALLLTGMENLADAQYRFFGKLVPMSPKALMHSAMQLYLPETLSKAERQNMLLNHSLIGFYSHSLPHKAVRAALENNMRDVTTPFIPNVTKLKHANIWRYCPLCAQHDDAQYGTAYWHVAHQLHTSLTCDQHSDIKLVSGCLHCRNEINDLKLQPIPSGSSCHYCNAVIEPEMFEHNDVTEWVQLRGLELLHDVSDLIRPTHAHIMKYGASYLASEQGIIGYSRQEMAQSDFVAWYSQHNLEEYYSEDVVVDSDFVTRIYSSIRYAKSVPTVTHLLVLNFFGLDRLNQLNPKI